MPNARNLELTAQEIERAKPGAFYMGSWLMSAEESGDAKCGTTGCIAAYATLARDRESHVKHGSTYNPVLKDLYYVKGDVVHKRDRFVAVAADWLGLDSIEYERLFLARGIVLSTCTREQAARACRRMGQGHEEIWDD